MYLRKIKSNGYAKLRKSKLKRQRMHTYFTEHCEEKKDQLFSLVNEVDQEILITKLKCSREKL